MSAAPWLPEPPTAAGTYWFYGRRHDHDNLRVRIVEVHVCSRGCGYMHQGMALNPAQMRGVWAPAVPPELPSILDMTLYLAAPATGS
jgi:hypothetical protein